jgi:hypothetical protein
VGLLHSTGRRGRLARRLRRQLLPRRLATGGLPRRLLLRLHPAVRPASPSSTLRFFLSAGRASLALPLSGGLCRPRPHDRDPGSPCSMAHLPPTSAMPTVTTTAADPTLTVDSALGFPSPSAAGATTAANARAAGLVPSGLGLPGYPTCTCVLSGLPLPTRFPRHLPLGSPPLSRLSPTSPGLPSGSPSSPAPAQRLNTAP